MNNTQTTTTKKQEVKEMTEKKYPDEIKIDSGKTVRVSTLPENYILKIHGRKIKVSDIPLVAARLKCGCYIRGIALARRDIYFCDLHHTDSYVVQIINK